VSRQKDRDEFMALMVRELAAEPAHHVTDFARKVMRHGATLHRMAEAECNGTWPFNPRGETATVCTRCDSEVARSSMVPDRSKPKNGSHFLPLICKECRLREVVIALCLPYGIVPKFGGDPRGCVLKLQVPSGATNDWGREGVCVP
jgi:hypothetical protein